MALQLARRVGRWTPHTRPSRQRTPQDHTSALLLLLAAPADAAAELAAHGGQQQQQ